jgi:hypothetical protein
MSSNAHLIGSRRTQPARTIGGTSTPPNEFERSFGTDNIGQNGDITSICEGTNKKNDLEYLARARRTGDSYGQAPVLWCALPLLRSTSSERGSFSHRRGRI